MTGSVYAPEAEGRVSHLHSHDFLVCLHHFVTYSHEHLKGQLALLRYQGDVVDLLILARQKTIHAYVSRLLDTLHMTDGVGEYRLESVARGARRADSGGQVYRRNIDGNVNGIDNFIRSMERWIMSLIAFMAAILP